MPEDQARNPKTAAKMAEELWQAAAETAERLREDMWSVEKASKFLGVPKGTLYQWASKKQGPRSYKVGNARRYDPADLRAWLVEHATEPAAS